MPQCQHYPKVSVIVPVFNDEARLFQCLSALECQSYPQNCYEVVVIDNGSDNFAAVKDLVEQFPQAALIQESCPGSYAARNCGIKSAQGEIFAFTDADCIPASDWLEKGVAHLQSEPDCGLVAGKIQLTFKNPACLTPVELFEEMTGFNQKAFIDEHHYGATANAFSTRDVVERVGPFNAQLKSSGDREWGQRIYRHGYRLIYAEDVCVAHPARSSFRELYLRTLRLVGGIYDLNVREQPSRWDKNRAFLKIFLVNLVPPLNFVRSVFQRRELKDLRARLKICWVMIVFRYVSAFEILRLRLGQPPARV